MMRSGSASMTASRSGSRWRPTSSTSSPPARSGQTLSMSGLGAATTLMPQSLRVWNVVLSRAMTRSGLTGTSISPWLSVMVTVPDAAAVVSSGAAPVAAGAHPARRSAEMASSPAPWMRAAVRLMGIVSVSGMADPLFGDVLCCAHREWSRCRGRTGALGADGPSLRVALNVQHDSALSKASLS
ncbi:exported hypothetical protein [Pseudoclavibacter sp. 8L]|nr:exported hypothetical protein [Pseudoclavibacter sp. 8L]